MIERNHTRRRFLESAASAIVAGKCQMLDQFFGTPDGELESLSRATGWVNSRPLTARDLRGKGVLVQFWTFTCINWLRTLPYVRAWADKYRASGLVVVGAHSPEFPFERNTDNVTRMTGALNVTYPVAIDTDFAIWTKFANRYWPALYLIDSKGDIRYQKFGEGAYDATERAIQQMLMETGARQFDPQLTPVVGKGLEAAADWATVKTGETYVGYERGENFASPGGIVRDRPHPYALPGTLRTNEWALAGDWTIAGASVALNQAPGRIAFRFHARDLHLVMGPPAGVGSIRFRVSLDGQPPGAAHGIDVDAQGNGVATDQRLYQLVRQPAPIGERLFEIEFFGRGIEAYAFTFG